MEYSSFHSPVKHDISQSVSLFQQFPQIHFPFQLVKVVKKLFLFCVYTEQL
jgi:hypothetical protein